jgi:hypothetical protein
MEHLLVGTGLKARKYICVEEDAFYNHSLEPDALIEETPSALL